MILKRPRIDELPEEMLISGNQYNGPFHGYLRRGQRNQGKKSGAMPACM